MSVPIRGGNRGREWGWGVCVWSGRRSRLTKAKRKRVLNRLMKSLIEKKIEVKRSEGDKLLKSTIFGIE